MYRKGKKKTTKPCKVIKETKQNLTKQNNLISNIKFKAEKSTNQSKNNSILKK